MEAIVDGFCGGGGASNGIYLATGRHPDLAIDHNADVIRTHTINNPDTKHIVSDIFKVNLKDHIPGKVGLAWYSPDCTDHSVAKNGVPLDARRRGLAWVIVKHIRQKHPRIIMLENVNRLLKWGPLDSDGYPIKEQYGYLFKRFVARLRYFGYDVEWHELVASDYGAATIRKRLFLIARN